MKKRVWGTVIAMGMIVGIALGLAWWFNNQTQSQAEQESSSSSSSVVKPKPKRVE